MFALQQQQQAILINFDKYLFTFTCVYIFVLMFDPKILTFVIISFSFHHPKINIAYLFEYIA